MAALFNRTAGVVEADFMRAFNSFSVRSKVQQADTRGRQYRVAAVPTLVVNGKYKVDGRMAGSNTGMLRIADYLIKKELAARAAPVAQSSAAQDAAASVAR
jgi:thiol:disulfide interchange protein DsbA